MSRFEFVLWWYNDGERYEIDTADDEQEAQYLAAEYQMAYGQGVVKWQKRRTR